MDKGRLIEELTPGRPFADCVLAVSGAEIKTAKNGTPYVQMVVSDKSGSRPAKRFQAAEDEQGLLCQSLFILADGQVDDNPDYLGHIKITRFRPVPKEQVDLNWFIPSLSVKNKQHQRRFADVVKSVRDPFLARLLRSVFHKDSPTWQQFKGAIAAKEMHHSERGGLLEHTVEVAELCQGVCAVLPGLRHDLVVTGAVFHDIGKLEEMDHEVQRGTYTPAGTLIGHTVLGAQMVDRSMRAIPNFPETLSAVVTHLILSHHGTPEFGAVCEPSLIEAQVLAQCDLISARAYQHRAAAMQAAPGQMFAFVKGIKSRVFVGDCGVDAGSETSEEQADEFDLSDAPPAMTFETGARRLLIRGRVAAGDPGRSSEEPEEEREVILPPGGADYLLHVTGDSMKNRGILEGDLVFVRTADTARNGEIVVASLLGEGELIKTYRDRNDDGQKIAPWLQSENPAYAPIPITEETRIQGKVTGLLRDF